MSQISDLLLDIRHESNLSQSQLAQLLQTSLASIVKWETHAAVPSPEQISRIKKIHENLKVKKFPNKTIKNSNKAFASNGIRQKELPLFAHSIEVHLANHPLAPILQRITSDDNFASMQDIEKVLSFHVTPAQTTPVPPTSGMSAGKNTYTYDAHTYHTKVPPQGIAELLGHYLPTGGLVLDPFAGSGMTGVATQVLGFDSILNELSPAACFIANGFTTKIDPELFKAGVQKVLQECQELRRSLYTTRHRQTGEEIEFEYTVWSYRVICSLCGHEFTLWDHCRKYGESVKEHKILSEFNCPNCRQKIKKSKLVRTTVVPVMIAYKEHNSISMYPLDDYDTTRLKNIDTKFFPVEGFYPQTSLGNGVNLRQPIKHGFDRIDKFYTYRNLVAMSHLWRTIHQIEDINLASFLAFTFTSLYQRVTRLSEFRFWGGSGNMAHFNVPHIFKEANVFTTFERKAQTILDHLDSTASFYRGNTVVRNNSATNLSYLPDNSVDLIFTDPPFGANINYSEMNLLWEAWLGYFTDNLEEAIINKYQNKGVQEYQELMTRSFAESYRVLRDKHWMLVVFMNSSEEVWDALRASIIDSGFTIQQVDVFDKQHMTFKQLVSDNAAGADLVLHCLKDTNQQSNSRDKAKNNDAYKSITDFLEDVDIESYRIKYIHVKRKDEFDFRTLYSLWVAQTLENDNKTVSFPAFRAFVWRWLNNQSQLF